MICSESISRSHAHAHAQTHAPTPVTVRQYILYTRGLSRPTVHDGLGWVYVRTHSSPGVNVATRICLHSSACCRCISCWQCLGYTLNMTRSAYKNPMTRKLETLASPPVIRVPQLKLGNAMFGANMQCRDEHPIPSFIFSGDLHFHPGKYISMGHAAARTLPSFPKHFMVLSERVRVACRITRRHPAYPRTRLHAAGRGSGGRASHSKAGQLAQVSNCRNLKLNAST